MKDSQVRAAIKRAKLNKKAVILSSMISGKGSGSLLLKVSKSGSAKWYAKFITSSKRESIQLGEYPFVPLKEAKEKAEELSTIHQKGKSVKAYVETEKLISQAGTYEQLIDEYIDSMKGREGEPAVRSYLTRHVKKRWPDLIKQPARDITNSDCLQIARAAHEEQGLKGGCNQLVGYLKSAFEFILSRENPVIRTRLKYALTHNPARSIKLVEEWKGVNEEYATVPVLLALYSSCNTLEKDKETTEHCCPMNIIYAAATQFLCLSGQRPAQVLRCRWSDLNTELSTLTIHNGKHKDKRQQRHVLPLTVRMMAVLQKLRAYSMKEDGYIFSSTNGRSHVPFTSYASYMKRHQRYYGLKEHPPKLIRCSWKTGASEARISQEGKDRVQAHSFGSKTGDLHYDKSKHLAVKLEALEHWDNYLFSRGKVVQLKRA